MKAMDAEIDCAALPAWNLGPYGKSAQDTVHPMFLAAFRAGYRACERDTHPPVPGNTTRAVGWMRSDGSLHKGCPPFDEPRGWTALLIENGQTAP